jgi:hypothetical protein
MGADIQDINNDGHPDLFTTDMLPGNEYRLKTTTSFDNYEVFNLRQTKGFYNQFTQNALQVNDTKGCFYETAFYSGVAASDWSWGALMFDADNDALNDIYVCNGIYRDVTDQDFIDFFANDVIQQMTITGKKEEVNKITEKMPSNPIPNLAFRNKGNLKFHDAGTEWGLIQPSFSNGAVYADLDNDGDLELVVNNVNQKAFIYKNNSREYNQNNYIAVQLRYRLPDTFAIGSTIRLYINNQVITREVIPARGFQSSVEYKQTIGLGKFLPDSMTVTWPDQTITTIIKPSVNQLHRIEYVNVQKRAKGKSNGHLKAKTLFESETAVFDKHNEDAYVDFYSERNVPFMLSRQGPKAAMADVNGDGLEDIFIGGARNQPSQLYLQTSKGFTKKETPDFKTFAFNDVTAALLFDCDKDGDLDLFTGGGGNFASGKPGNYLNQLFINDGRGNYSLKRGALPLTNTNCGAAVVIDYDHDGADDLFVGSRSVPQSYGETPASFLLRNDGKGNFTDVTVPAAPVFEKTGMITAAVAADVNKDGKQDILLTGEWMSPKVFSYNGKQFEELISGLENYSGWWQSMSAADVDKDGDMDLLLGNIGENFYLQPNRSSPVKLWITDTDNNGISDKLISRTYGGKDVPVFMKREVTDQVPSLKKLNLKHNEYAKKTAQELLGSAAVKKNVENVNYTSSCVAYNNGKGIFTVKELPYQAQLSSINAMKAVDLNHDGYPDVIAAGNFFDLLPQFCRVDAFNGCVLINDTKGGFYALPISASGLSFTGQVRDIVTVDLKSGKYFVFLRNNEVPAVYKIRN